MGMGKIEVVGPEHIAKKFKCSIEEAKEVLRRLEEDRKKYSRDILLLYLREPDVYLLVETCVDKELGYWFTISMLHIHTFIDLLLEIRDEKRIARGLKVVPWGW